jgi:hypothetical protein
VVSIAVAILDLLMSTEAGYWSETVEFDGSLAETRTALEDQLRQHGVPMMVVEDLPTRLRLKSVGFLPALPVTLEPAVQVAGGTRATLYFDVKG